jgi:DNA-binding CsgD family transcriptional regulator
MASVEPGIIPCIPDDIESLVSLGRTDEAQPLVDRLERQGLALDRPWALGAAARCRGLLAGSRGERDAARSALEEAVAQHARTIQPFELARTLLVRGVIERRSRQKRAARTFLEEALGGFEALGAALWSAKARAELARVGGTTGASTDLTPTEERVARLVVEGKTNREVANALFVSIKTVEANLSRIYHKRGVRSRAELIRTFPETTPIVPPSGGPGRSHA